VIVPTLQRGNALLSRSSGTAPERLGYIPTPERGNDKTSVGWISVAHPPCRPLVDALRLSTLRILFHSIWPQTKKKAA